MALRIFLVDDHTVLRTGLRLLLETQPDMEVVGEAADAEEGLRLLPSLNPDLMVLDLSMPGMGGLGMLRHAMAAQPRLKVIVLTMHDDAEFLRAALLDGASGYILKRAADTELLTAIRKVASGETYVYPSLAAKLVTLTQQQRERDSGMPLSSRECEVLTLIAQGFTQQEIANRLVVSVKTVETHKARISEKLGLRTRAELVRYAIDHGLVPME